MNRWLDDWMDGWMDERTDGRMMIMVTINNHDNELLMIMKGKTNTHSPKTFFEDSLNYVFGCISTLFLP